MDTWNLRQDAKFRTKLASNLYWVPANYLNSYSVLKHNSSFVPNNLYELLLLFQSVKMRET